MRHSVDWISFSVRLEPLPKSLTSYAAEAAVGRAVAEVSPYLADLLASAPGIERVAGRNPYSNGMKFTESGALVLWGYGQSHALVELSGKACAWLRATGFERHVISEVADHCTRIDIATDIETELDPAVFVEAGYSDRVRSRSNARTPSGLTEYVGSKSSDRYARVYRYADPHPRSHLLRVEHVMRRRHAKAIAKHVGQHGTASAAVAAGKRMRWGHPTWAPKASDEGGYALVKQVTSDAKTIIWLKTQVTAAFHRLVASGEIDDPVGFVMQTFIDTLEESP